MSPPLTNPARPRQELRSGGSSANPYSRKLQLILCRKYMINYIHT